MKENEDIVLFHKRKRKRHKIKLAIESLVALIIGSILLLTYSKATKNEYISYREKADVNYKINLIENEFYEDTYVDVDSVVASLIKDIEVKFNYNLDLDEEQEYIYSYKILAQIDVIETTNSTSIYKIEEELLNKDAKSIKSKKLLINEKIDIDYNEYNEKINKFINIYSLNNMKSTLTVNMELYIKNKNDGSILNKQNKVMSLEIPLTTKTVSIDIDTTGVNGTGQILVKDNTQEKENLQYLLITGVIIVFIGIVILFRLIKYIIEKRSAEVMYKQELKNIMFNYKSYIQEINNDDNLKQYKQLQINTFKEMLEMRETIQAPILMYKEGEERTKFMIINNDMLFVFILGSKEIRNRLREESQKKNKK